MATSVTRLKWTKALRCPFRIPCRAFQSTYANSLQWLSICKTAELKSIANAIGSNTGGTKAVLAANLHHDLQRDRFALPNSTNGRNILGTGHNIVSIDMGIRNLAFCRISLPPNWASAAQSTVPTVHEWARIVVSKRANAESLVDHAKKSASKEAFDPATYAQHAYLLVEKLLSTSHPTQILIERQRFRSMGGSAVQEWTLRVNMFEAMLYAVLKTFSEQRSWNGAVHPVGPAKVSKFWLGNAEGGSGTNSTSQSSKTKAAKIDLLANWLENGERFELKGSAAKLGQAFLEKRKGAKRVAVKQDEMIVDTPDRSVEVEMGKLDDLADCLLQGMAWVEWERNRRTILTDGIQALPEL